VHQRGAPVTFYVKHRMYGPATTEQRDRLLRQIREDFIRDSDVVGVFLAGSLAAGTVDAHSDIDLRVVVEPTALSRFSAAPIPSNPLERLSFQ
jgi:predicted nucleotidyltransferase